MNIVHVRIDDVFLDHEFNCRGEFFEEDVKSLSDNIKQHGLLQPIIIRVCGKQDHGKMYTIVSGHRRFMACRMLNWERIPARILDLNNIDAENINAMENIHRLDLNMYQEAKAIEHLVNLPDDTVAEIVNKNNMWVAARRMLLTLPPEIQKLAAIGYLKPIDVREIYLRQTDPEAIKQIISLVKESRDKKHFIDQITKKKTGLKKKPLLRDVMTLYDWLKINHPDNTVALNSLLWAANKITLDELEGVLGCTLSTLRRADSTGQQP